MCPKLSKVQFSEKTLASGRKEATIVPSGVKEARMKTSSLTLLGHDTRNVCEN